MAYGRHLEKSKIRHISATDWPILIKFGMLTQIGSLKRTSRQKFEFFENPRRQRPPFWKTVISQYLRNRLTNYHEIWHGDAHWHFLYQRSFKIAILKIQHGGQPPCWKIENATYVSNRLADLDEIWQAYGDCVYQAYRPVKIWIFENPRWRRPPFWKTVKSQYLYNHCLLYTSPSPRD